MKSKELDQFYTKKNIAEKCFNKTIQIIKQENITFDLWLEPSAGTGAFFNLLPDNKLGIDLEPKTDNVILHDFLTFPLENKNYVSIGNPPFGKNSSLAIKFFNKCAGKSLLIALVLPKTFKKHSTLKKIDKFFHLIYEEDLPTFSFEFENKDYNVPCVFQIWKKKKEKREDITLPTKHLDFTFTTKDKANYAIQRVGANAGRLKENFSKYSATSHYFIQSNENVKIILKQIDWTSVKYNTAGNPSISKTELISLYNYFKKINQNT